MLICFDVGICGFSCYVIGHIGASYINPVATSWSVFLNLSISNFKIILFLVQSIVATIGTRNMSTEAESPLGTSGTTKLTTKEKLKKAVKEYGSTVIVFHVSISILSLGSCYLLMSRYVIYLIHLLTSYN